MLECDTEFYIEIIWTLETLKCLLYGRITLKRASVAFAIAIKIFSIFSL